MFVDEAVITVRGGDGGDGCASFRREKFVPRGGPDGGDGGNGGSVFLEADPQIGSLLELRYRPLLKAGRGRHGQGSNKVGRCGEDLTVRVPVGTVVFDEDHVRVLADLAQPASRFTAAAGGRGGRGNARFKSSIRQAPRRCEEGRAGGEHRLQLELKLLADVGLIGFPNAGKSTLISRISAARPRIADYPFTTLVPNLGVVDAGDYRSFVVADIPGLIEGAHRGVGLGHRFLRHIERCRLLLHLVDPLSPDRDAVPGIEALRHELTSYSSELAAKTQWLVVTKGDVVQAPEGIDVIRRLADRLELPCYEISAVSGAGLPGLIQDVASHLARVPRQPALHGAEGIES